MKDFPLFTTESGIASLTLSNIPYTKTAYILLQDSRDPDQLLNECRDFCVAVGAQNIYASGHVFLEKFPVYTSVLMLECSKSDLPETSATALKVTKENMRRWRMLYWDRMRNVHNAAYISESDMEKYLELGQCYFVHSKNDEIGLGMVKDDEIAVIAGIVPGRGCDVLAALAGKISGNKIKVTVSDQNVPAMRLYNRLGFQCVGVISKWYKI